MALQTGGGVIDGLYYLASAADTVVCGRLPGPDVPPVLEVSPGSVVTVDTVSHEGLRRDQGADPAAFFAAYGVPAPEVLRDACAVAAATRESAGAQDVPFVLTGPIGVRGAVPGDAVTVEVLALRLRTPYGVVSNRHAGPGTTAPLSAFCPVAPRDGRLEGRLTLDGPGSLRFPLDPAVGLAGLVAPDGPGESADPRTGPGVVRGLRSGATVSLPAQVPGARLFLGDPHYAELEVDGVPAVLEAPLRVTLRLSLER